ncbi:MAG: hypothetical protein ACM359_19810 [Bacillota bacterium]
MEQTRENEMGPNQGPVLGYASNRAAVPWTVCLKWMATGILAYQLLSYVANIVTAITQYAGFNSGIRGGQLGWLVAGMNYLTLIVALAGLAFWCMTMGRSGRPLRTRAWVLIVFVGMLVILLLVGINVVASPFLVRAMTPSEFALVQMARGYAGIVWQIGFPLLLLMGIAWLSHRVTE